MQLTFVFYHTNLKKSTNLFMREEVDYVSYLKISGTDVSKYIQTLSIEHEPVWSTNAGRTLDATFVGDIIAWKWKLIIATKPLTQKESALITSLIENRAFFDVSFIPPDSQTDTFHTARMYTNAPASTLYSYHKNLIRYQALAFNVIEQ